MQLTIGIGNTSSIDKECGIYRRGIQNPNYPGFLYLMRDPLDNVTRNANAARGLMRLQWGTKVLTHFHKMAPFCIVDILSRLNNRIKWRTRNVHFTKNILSTHTLEIHQKLYMCASISVSFQLLNHIDVNSGYRSPSITSSRNSNWPYNSVVNKSMSPAPPIT